MRNIRNILIAMLALLLASCTDYAYNYEVDVWYTNGDFETIPVYVETFNGQTPVFNIYSHKKAEPELKYTVGGNYYMVATGVRRYKVRTISRREI